MISTARIFAAAALLIPMVAAADDCATGTGTTAPCKAHSDTIHVDKSYPLPAGRGAD